MKRLLKVKFLLLFLFCIFVFLICLVFFSLNEQSLEKEVYLDISNEFIYSKEVPKEIAYKKLESNDSIDAVKMVSILKESGSNSLARFSKNCVFSVLSASEDRPFDDITYDFKSIGFVCNDFLSNKIEQFKKFNTIKYFGFLNKSKYDLSYIDYDLYVGLIGSVDDVTFFVKKEHEAHVISGTIVINY